MSVSGRRYGSRSRRWGWHWRRHRGRHRCRNRRRGWCGCWGRHRSRSRRGRWCGSRRRDWGRSGSRRRRRRGRRWNDRRYGRAILEVRLGLPSNRSIYYEHVVYRFRKAAIGLMCLHLKAHPKCPISRIEICPRQRRVVASIGLPRYENGRPPPASRRKFVARISYRARSEYAVAEAG